MELLTLCPECFYSENELFLSRLRHRVMMPVCLYWMSIFLMLTHPVAFILSSPVEQVPLIAPGLEVNKWKVYETKASVLLPYWRFSLAIRCTLVWQHAREEPDSLRMPSHLAQQVMHKYLEYQRPQLPCSSASHHQSLFSGTIL